MVSEHASPMAVLGGEDAGGQNVHVAAITRRPDQGGELGSLLRRRGVHHVRLLDRRLRRGFPQRALHKD